jgi:dienelactone hydrolase
VIAPRAAPRAVAHTARAPTVARRVRLALALLALALLALAFAPAASRHARAAALLLRLTGSEAWLAHRYEWPVRVEDVQITRAGGVLRARLYLPATRPERGVVLVHGVQYAGMDEPRVVNLARQVASSGLVVLTPHVTSLSEFRLDPSAADDVRAAFDYLAARPEARRGVGLLGASLAGGLVLRVASEPGVRAHLSFVMSVGGHYDLARVLRYAAAPADAQDPAPDPYVAALFAYASAEQLVPPAEVSAFRAALRLHLAWDAPGAQRACAAVHGEARTTLERLIAGDRSVVAPRLTAMLPALAPGLAALSPAGHLAALRGVTVLLVHGERDNVVPPSESSAIAREIGDGRDVRLVFTPLIDHVNFGAGGSARDQWALVHLAAQLYRR